jgi:hypothetical protein
MLKQPALKSSLIAAMRRVAQRMPRIAAGIGARKTALFSQNYCNFLLAPAR